MTPHRAASEALAGWESEGGAQHASAAAKGYDRALITADEHMLRRLGMAVILQWNSLPQDIQRKIFEDAIAADNRDRDVPLNEQVARFLHRHKNDRRKRSR